MVARKPAPRNCSIIRTLRPDALRSHLLGVALLVLPASPGAASGKPAADPVPARVPVILDTDIGQDIDDTWALVELLKSPELDLKLVVTDYGNTEYRARIVARLLEVAGRTDVPVGVGLKGSDEEGGQADWVRGYDLARYPGRVHRDGVKALVDTAMASKEPMTLIAIGPCPNLKAALEREPRIAGRLRLVGMYGSLHRGYGSPTPEPEWNVKVDVPAARAMFAAPWIDATFTPLDTCGRVHLDGSRYARVRDSHDPLLRALMENYRQWCAHQGDCASDPKRVSTRSSTLFDTVAVYLAIRRDLVKTESLGIRVTDGGMTVPDPAGRLATWATEWKTLDGYEDWLVERLTSPTVSR
jgi:inosine-uridine nucleoside N-ribohydrolase